MIATQKISAKLIALVNAGVPINEAFDQVFGNGAYEKLAGEIYDELNSKN